MTQEQIREVVSITIDELISRRLYNPVDYITMLRAVEVNLFQFFGGKSDERIAYILRHLSDDAYINIIFYHYRDELTLEAIAEIMGKDISTIKRNKKRLIIRMYEMMGV